MDQLIAQGQWWWLFPIPLLTFLFAISGSWIGSLLGKRTEHWQWLRNEKRKEYIAAVDSLDSLILRISRLRTVERAVSPPEDFSYLTPLRMLGPENIGLCVRTIIDNVYSCVDVLETSTTQAERDRMIPHLMTLREEQVKLIRLIREDLKVAS